MSFGAYGMKMQVPTNTDIPMTNDLWFNIGSVLGRFLGSGYEERGAKKNDAALRAKLDEMTGRGPSQGDLGQAQQGAVGPLTQVSVGGNTIESPLTTNNSGDSQQGAIGPSIGKFAPLTATVGGQQSQAANLATPQTSESIVGYKPNQQGAIGLTQTVPRDLAAEKADYVAAKYANSANPEGDAQQVETMSQMIQQNLAKAKLNKVPLTDGDAIKNELRKVLVENGTPSWQIDSALKRIQPDVDETVKEARKTVYDGMFEQFLGAIRAKDYVAAQMIGSRMAEYNPDGAKIAMAGLPTMQSEYNNEVTDKRLDKQHLYKKEDMKFASDLSWNATKNAKILEHNLAFEDFVKKNAFQIKAVADAYNISPSEAAKIVYGGKKGTNANGGPTSQQIETAKWFVKDEADWNEKHPDKPYPYKDKARASHNLLGSVVTGGEQSRSVPQNINDYDEVQDWLTQLKAAAGGEWSDAQLAQLARQMVRKMLGQNSGYLEQALKDRGWI